MLLKAFHRKMIVFIDDPLKELLHSPAIAAWLYFSKISIGKNNAPDSVTYS